MFWIQKFYNNWWLTVVRHQFAEEHKLFGEEIVITLTTVNGMSNVTAKLYLVEFVDEDGDWKIVKAFGLDCITGKLPTINYGKLKSESSPKSRRSGRAWSPGPPE